MPTPPKFRPEFVAQAAKLAAAGWTMAEMAAFWDVSRDAVQKWMVNKPDFAKAIKENRALPDSRVEESLFHRAIGYSHEAEEIKVINDAVVRVPTIKHYPPDPVACIFWLKNRQPDRWRDKPEGTDEGGDAMPVKVELVVMDARRKDGPSPAE